MKHVIGLHPKRLTDGSIVYDVSIDRQFFPCVSEEDAGQFITKIKTAIRDHTNDDVCVRLAQTVAA